MKKILVFLTLFASLKSFGQYPVNQSLGSDSTLVTSKGATKSRFINKVFTDTAQANLERIKFYDGAQIYTKSGGGQLWIRDSTLNKWTGLTTTLTSLGSGYRVLYGASSVKSLLAYNGLTADSSQSGSVRFGLGGLLSATTTTIDGSNSKDLHFDGIRGFELSGGGAGNYIYMQSNASASSGHARVDQDSIRWTSTVLTPGGDETYINQEDIDIELETVSGTIELNSNVLSLPNILLESDTTGRDVLVIDRTAVGGVTKVRPSKFGGGSTPTLQQVLTAGSNSTGNGMSVTGGSNIVLYNSINNGITLDDGAGNGLLIEANAGVLQLSSVTDVYVSSGIRLTTNNDAGQDRLLGTINATGSVGNITIGSGLSLSSGVLSASGGGSTYNPGNSVTISNDSLFARKASQSLTDGATITWDLQTSINAHVTLGGNRTLAFTNIGTAVGSSGILIVTQDGTGSRTLTLPASCKVVNGGSGALTLTTTAAAVDIISFYVFSSTVIYVSYGRNFN